MLKPITIEARDLPDAWYSCLYNIVEHDNVYTIDRGSYKGQQRLEFDYVTIHIKHPGVRPLLPEIVPSFGIPNPVAEGYLDEYLPYLMTSEKMEGEDYCYSDDTEILTDSGWKLFKDLNTTEYVATLNPITGSIEYQKPVGYNKFKFKGLVYEFNGRRINFCVNSGHSLFVGVGNSYSACANSKFKLIPVDEVSKFKFIKFKRDAIWYGDSVDTFELPEVFYNNYRYKDYGSVISIPMSDWLWFFGLWLAEGDLGRRKDKYSYQVRISLNSSDDRSIAKKRIAKLGLGVLEYKRWLIISNKQLYIYLDRFGKSHDKFIPSEIKNVSVNHLKNLFDGMMFGDGDKTGYRYTTVSKKLANDFSEICFKLGKAAMVRFDSCQSAAGFKNGGCYRINISDFFVESVVENIITKQRHNGYLYCVEVPNHHIVYVRRNGKPHWSGNTYGQYLESQISEVIKMYKEDGHGTNQAYMTVGDPPSIYLDDPPCLRGIDTRIEDNKLHFIVYFRSWDLYSGFPANLGAIQLLKEYMAAEIGVDDGEIIAASKGLHLYDYVWDIAKQITYKDK